MKLKLQHLKVLSSCMLVLFLMSCQDESNSLNNVDSDLIKKINAVQDQVMSQGNMTKLEEQALLSLCSIMSTNDGLATYTSDNSIILKDLKTAPLFEGCENLSQVETKACFKSKISEFIEREFDISVSKNLKLSEPKTVEVFFLINEKGKLTGMKVRNSEVTVQAEILRVLRKIPLMKPASQNGKKVSVLCSATITYGNIIKVNIEYIPERPD